jgi:hypothetical protein
LAPEAKGASDLCPNRSARSDARKEGLPDQRSGAPGCVAKRARAQSYKAISGAQISVTRAFSSLLMLSCLREPSERRPPEFL